MSWSSALRIRTWAGGIAAAGLLAFSSACGGGEVSAPEEPPAAPVRVIAAPIAEVEWPETFEAPGTIQARTSATLASRAMGYIREVRPNEGDRVEAGQVVVTLDAPELDIAQRQARTAIEEARTGIPEADSAIESARAQLELAETTLARMQDLLNKRSVSQQEFDEAASRVRVARSARDMAEARRKQLDQKIRQAEEALAAVAVQIAFLEVKAPFAGRVTKRMAEPGVLASPGLPLLEVEREGAQRLEVNVPEARLPEVRRGQSVEVSLDAVPQPLTGRVDEIVPQIDPASRTFLVKIALPARGDLRSGLFGRARFSTGSRTVLAAPRVAVIEQGQLRGVLVTDGGIARLRHVRLGEEREGMVEVLSGLTAGEQVIAPPPPGLVDGQRVEVSP